MFLVEKRTHGRRKERRPWPADRRSVKETAALARKPTPGCGRAGKGTEQAQEAPTREPKATAKVKNPSVHDAAEVGAGGKTEKTPEKAKGPL